ncbi:MAG: hypothetical protein HC764_25410 [Pleurocapsa sp. CRU_1_2]|nr:hypothetical protein [Pleurocapsa sp. CRU_1_2]
MITYAEQYPLGQALTVKPVRSTQERQLITIEFAPPLDPAETEYQYEHPLFVFGDQVIQKNNSSTPFTVCGMELVQSTTPSGRLLNQPRWKYKLTNRLEQIWLDESALTRCSTCSQCSHFNDYQDNLGRGWCNLFDTTAKTHHQRTNDCDLFADSDPLDTPHPGFALDSKVKVIDPTEHHTEWATFVIIGRQYNHELYRNSESYLSEAAWYYWLVIPNYESTYAEPLWVAENEICLFDEAHLISTEDIF